MQRLDPEDASTVDQIVEHIRDGVAEGRFSPGQRLIENDITRQLGVSRGPLREALRRLAAEGLIEIAHHRGARVRAFTPEEIGRMFEIREVLEGLAARRAARAVVADPDLGRRVSQLGDRMQAAVGDGKLQAYVGLNKEFHDLIVEAAESPELALLTRQLQTPTLRLVFRGAIDWDMTRRSHTDHARIIAAVSVGDEDAAEMAMRRHIRASAVAVLASLLESSPGLALKARRRRIVAG